MTPAELVEAVARTINKHRTAGTTYAEMAADLIACLGPTIRAQALEEAARVSEGSVRQECCGNAVGGYSSPPECCGDPDVTPMYPNEIAAAIRALIEERKDD